MFYHSVLLDPLISIVENNPAKVLLFSKKEKITAQQLLDESKTLAFNLSNKGFKENDTVVIAARPGMDFLKIIYATIILRGRVAIIDPEMGRDNYLNKLNQLNPKWGFVDTGLLFLREHILIRSIVFAIRKNVPFFPKNKKIKIIGVGKWLPMVGPYLALGKLFSNKKDVNLIRDNVNHKYLIVYTSGTLTEPKGVFHSFNSVSKSLLLLENLVKAEADSVLGTYLPHFMLLGISLGIPVSIYDPNLSVKKKIDLIAENRISIMFGPPSDFMTMIEYCEANNCKLPPSLKHLLLGSAPIHSTFLKRLLAVSPENMRATCLYGMTEHLMIAYMDGRKKVDYRINGDVVGELFPGVNIQFTDEKEIILKSDQLFEHYFHESTRPEFHASGDLGELDQNNYLILTGRKKDMIIRRSMNIYPALYEPTIKKIEGIDEAIMVGVWNKAKEDQEVYLVVESEKKIPIKLLMKKMQAGEYSIDKEALPDEIVFEKIPRKGRQNKIDRIEMQKLIQKKYG